MGKQSKIEWCDATFNPWWGCAKVSPACDNCYAEGFSKRVGFSATGSKFPIWGKEASRRFFGEKYWTEPRHWNKSAQAEGVRKRVFCGSMCDVMEDRRDLDEWRDRLYDLIYETPALDWLLLTKRPQNFRRFLPPSMIASPLPNVWGMTTVENPEYLWRAEVLAHTPFAVRGISYEPALSSVDFRPWLGPGKIGWIVTGHESGPRARPCEEGWVRFVKRQCSEKGAAFFYKQALEGRKVVATPMLDGRTWMEFPEVVHV